MPVFNVEHIGFEQRHNEKGVLDIKGVVLYRGDDTYEDLRKGAVVIWNADIEFIGESIVRSVMEESENFVPIEVHISLKVPNDLMDCAIKVVLRTLNEIIAVEGVYNVFPKDVL